MILRVASLVASLVICLNACSGAKTTEEPTALSTPTFTSVPSIGNVPPSTGASPADWVHQFCVGPRESEDYIAVLGPAVEMTRPLAVRDLEPTKKALHITALRLAATIQDNASKLASQTPPNAPSDALARQQLLDIYQQLEQALTDILPRINEIPTTDPNRFEVAFLSAVSSVNTAVKNSKRAVRENNSTLSQAFNADPACTRVQ